eukprot:scaffold99440_cov63-Phaeocystis_antarctica.AAC.7
MHPAFRLCWVALLVQPTMSRAGPIWPASAAQAADWPRLAEARRGLRRALALKGASGEPAGRGLSPHVFHIGPAHHRRLGIAHGLRACGPAAARPRRWTDGAATLVGLGLEG